jgi:hypothetical protein
MDTTCLNISSIHSKQFDGIVSERLHYIYVPIYKSAHTSIKRRLWQIENRYGYEIQIPEHYFGVHYSTKKKNTHTIHHQPWPIYQKNDNQLWLNYLIGDYLKFTVVRNPYSRLLSAYLDKIRPHSQLNADKKEEVRLHYNLMQYPDSFACFVEQLCQQSDNQVNLHWQSQTYIIAFDLIHYDKIGHVENLAEFYDFLQTQFPKAREIPLNNAENILHQTSAASKLIDFYTPQLQQKVYQRYKKDFINFGYSESLEIVAPIDAVRISGSHQELLESLLVDTL